MPSFLFTDRDAVTWRVLEWRIVAGVVTYVGLGQGGDYRGFARTDGVGPRFTYYVGTAADRERAQHVTREELQRELDASEVYYEDLRAMGYPEWATMTRAVWLTDDRPAIPGEDRTR